MAEVIDISVVERSLLALMLDKEQAPNVISEVEPEDFQRPEHRELFLYMRSRYEEGKDIDLIVLATELKQNVRAVMDIAGYATFAKGNITAQADKLKENREKNEMIYACEKAIKDLRTSNPDLDACRQFLLEKISPKVKDSSLVGPKEAAQLALKIFAERKDKKSNGGIFTTFVGLNRCLNGGCEPGQLLIIAAKTKKGKSAFVSNILRDIGVTQRISSLLINTEMSQDQISLRNMSLLSGVDFYKIATGATNEDEDQRIFDGIEKIGRSQLYTLNEPDLNINKMVSRLRQYVIQHKVKIAAVDYIGRMDTQDPKLQEHQVLKIAAKKLKTLAQQLHITIIMLAQITEDGNLEGAKAMKNECDLFAELRPLSEAEMGQCVGFNYALVVELNRSGPPAKIPLNYYGDKLTFTDTADDVAKQFAPEGVESGDKKRGFRR